MNGTMGGRQLDAAKIEAAYVGFKTQFQNRLNGITPLYAQVSEVVQTENVLDRQIWLSQVPAMKRWIGPKQIYKLSAESMPISTEPYEASLEVSKHDILNDNLGLYKGRINTLADRWPQAIDQRVFMMLAAGASVATPIAFGTTYDGQNLIDVDHTALSSGGVAQSNKVTGALGPTVFSTAVARFSTFLDDQGVPVAAPTGRLKLVVGPANRDAARTLLGTEFKTDGTTNLDKAAADLIVTPYIQAGTYNIGGKTVTLTGLEWLLIPEGSTALLVHIKRGVEFLSVTEGEYAFRTGKYLYGTEAEFGAAYGLWQEIVGGPGA
jgi:phage major head subunit gpT-like protein